MGPGQQLTGRLHSRMGGGQGDPRTSRSQPRAELGKTYALASSAWEGCKRRGKKPVSSSLGARSGFYTEAAQGLAAKEAPRPARLLAHPPLPQLPPKRPSQAGQAAQQTGGARSALGKQDSSPHLRPLLTHSCTGINIYLQTYLA